MGDWNRDTFHIYANKRVRTLIERNLDILEQEFDGPSEVFRIGLETIEEEFNLDDRIAELENELEELNQRKQRREAEQKSQKLSSKLAKLEERKEEVKSQEPKNEEEIRAQIVERRRRRGQDVEAGEIQDAIEKQVERELERKLTPEEKEEKIAELDEEIKEVRSELEDLPAEARL